MKSVINRCFGPEDSVVKAFVTDETTSADVTHLCKCGLWTIPGFLSKAECANVIEATERLGYEDAPVSTSGGPVMMKDYRNNLRVMIDDPASAQVLFSKLKMYVPLALNGRIAVGLNERFRYYKYHPGMFFQQHYDGAFYRSQSEFSLITFLVNLNSGYQGGQTAFYDRRLPDGKYLNQPEEGKAVLFLHRGWLHEGVQVAEGTKYLLRSDVMYRLPEARTLANYEGTGCGLCTESTRIVTLSCDHQVIQCGCGNLSSVCPYC